jgi:hypothetical protein
MKKKLFTLLLPIILSGCVLIPVETGNENPLISNTCKNWQTIKGEKTFDSINSLYIKDSLKVHIIKSHKNKIVWSGQTTDGLPLNIENTNKSLNLSTPNGCSSEVEVTVYSKDIIDNLDISGASSLHADSDTLSRSLLTADISGASQVHLCNEKISNLELSLSGASSLETNDITSANIDISGASSVNIGDIEKLRAEASGASSIIVQNTKSLDITQLDLSGLSRINNTVFVRN